MSNKKKERHLERPHRRFLVDLETKLIEKIEDSAYSMKISRNRLISLILEQNFKNKDK